MKGGQGAKATLFFNLLLLAGACGASGRPDGCGMLSLRQSWRDAGCRPRFKRPARQKPVN